MGIAYRRDPESDLALAVWHGPVSCEEWSDQVRRLVAEFDGRPTRRFLTDIRAAGDVSTITDAHIGEMAQLFASALRGTKAKVAVVAADLFEAAETFERESTLSGVATTIVFNHLGTACSWLGVDADIVQRRISALRREIITRRAGFVSDREEPSGNM
jgi:hypothetical protein